MLNENDPLKSVQAMNVAHNNHQYHFDLKSDESFSIESTSSVAADSSDSSEIFSIAESTQKTKSNLFPGLKASPSPEKTGFERGLELEEILGKYEFYAN